MDQAKGFGPQQDDDSVEIPDSHIKKYLIGPSDEVHDGDW